MRKKIFISIFIFIGMVLYFYSYREAINPPVPNVEKYIEGFNEGLKDKNKKYLEYQNKKNTPEEKGKAERYWSKMRAITQGQLKEIEFYGKVIDQYGSPVSDATVKYNARSGHMAEGIGYQVARTNKQGFFVIKDVVGSGLSVHEMIRPGYQFAIGDIKNFENYPRFEDSNLWENHTKDNPFIFKAWKIERYPKVKMSERTLYLLTPDGRASTFDLFAQGKQQFKKGVDEGDFTVSFNRIKNIWSVRLELLQGGILESNNLYLNLAPESGYQTSITYTFPIEGQDTVEKYYYVKLRNGYYGKYGNRV